MAFSLPPLPWAKDALAPHLSAETIDFHYGKHHNAYVTNLNKLTGAQQEDGQQALEALIRSAVGDPAKTGVFNNAAQIWNHTFYWNCMKPNGGGKPSGALLRAIERDFGDWDAFRAQFKDACVTQFGSGWGWLVENKGKLAVTKTANADTPLAHGTTALLTCDVWEHAYYIDFRNCRPDYVDVFLDHLVNWEWVASRL